MQKIITATLSGFDADLVEIETDVSNGLPTTIIVGLPDTMVQESKERVRSALRYTSFQYPPTRVAINLAPSNLPKIGSHFDLGIALSILLAAGLIEFNPERKIFIGELSLDGQVRPGDGVLSMILAAKQAGITEVFIPIDNLAEASLVKGITIFGIQDLNQLIGHLMGLEALTPLDANQIKIRDKFPSKSVIDFGEIAGQIQAKRGLEIAAAGWHNIRMIGPPGSGKTMLAKALLGILPVVSSDELLEIIRIFSLAGLGKNQLVGQRPFRSPHHTASHVALIGGGKIPKPGEVSLAHGGVLFLDEFPEFPRQVLEVLRQPLEENCVTISRASRTVRFPANFMLVAAQNPCHCGNFNDPLLQCVCHPAEVIKYNKKISGPLLDRIDLHVNVPRLAYSQFSQTNGLEKSAIVKERIESAVKIQHQRFKQSKFNSQMSSIEVKNFCRLEASTEQILSKAADRYQLSGRSIHRILKIARTIADLNNSGQIKQSHLVESLQYRLEK